MSTSKLQRQTSKFLSIYFGQYTIKENIRPDWLITQEGERLELDFLIEELNIAIEVQGKQHFAYTPFFHDSHEDFKNRLRWDRFKKERCKAAQIELIEITSQSDLDILYDFIPESENGVESLEEKTVAQIRDHIFRIEAKGDRSIRRQKQLAMLALYDDRIAELIGLLDVQRKESKKKKIAGKIERMKEHRANTLANLMRRK